MRLIGRAVVLPSLMKEEDIMRMLSGFLGL